jgi:PAS domain S-box-containing protein
LPVSARASSGNCTFPAGPAIWIHVDYYPDRGTDGEVRGFLVCYANVDQLKRLELEAGGREHRLRLVTDSVGSPIIHFDRNLKLRFANKPFGDWIGVAPDDLLGRRMQELIAGGTFADMDEHIDRAFSGAKVSFERRERKHTGELRWVRMTLFPDRAVGGRVDGIFAVMTDIDDDVRIRDALTEQEVQLRLFADNIPGPDRLSRSRLDVHVRQPGVRQLGGAAAGANLRAHAVRGAGAGGRVVPAARARARAQRRARRIRAHGRAASGEERWVHGRVAPDFDVDGKLRGIYCTEYDIHDLKRTEQALAAREEQLRLFTDNIPDPVVYLDTGRRYAFVNDAFLQLNGLDRAAVIGKTTAEVVGLENTTSETPYQDRAFAGETVSFERALVDASGRSRWIRGRMVPDHKIDGAIQGVYVVLHEISELKQAQEALRASESELRLIMDNVPARVAYIDREFHYRFLNRHNEEWLGLKRDELTGRAVADVVGDERFAQMRPLLERVLQGETVSVEQLLAQPVGDERWESVHYAPEPRRRRPGDRHLRRAHRRARREAQRGRAAPRQLDAVLAHQQHAARGARVGSRLPLWSAGRRRPRSSSAGAPRKCSGCLSTAIRCCTTRTAARSPNFSRA